MKHITQYLCILVAMITVASCNPPSPQQDGKKDSVATDSNVMKERPEASFNMIMHPDYAKSVARTAYIWAYPMINMLNRREMVTKAPYNGLYGGVIPVAPRGRITMLHNYIDPGQNFIACPNQDVVYGMGFFSLDEEPVVIQVPDIGDRFWVYAIYDQRTDQVGQLGKPYGSKPGFYLLVGPNWKGTKPEGITAVIQSPTELTNCIPRIFMDDTDEDRAAIQPIINQVMAYPLSEFDGKMKTINWKDVKTIPANNQSKGETKWVMPDKFFDQLSVVLKNVPPLPGEEAMYSQFNALLKILENNPELKKELIAELTKLDETLIRDYMQWKYNGKAAGNGWNRSVNNASWGIDYYNRTGSSRSNMFDNRPSETQYLYTDNTTSGKKLVGSKNYKITFKAGELPPVNGFWSMTMYNSEHFFEPNDLHRFSLGTKNKTLKYGENGSLVLYAGNKNPGKENEANWLPAPKGEFSLYIRAYWGKESITNGSWIPPVIEEY